MINNNQNQKEKKRWVATCQSYKYPNNNLTDQKRTLPMVDNHFHQESLDKELVHRCRLRGSYDHRAFHLFQTNLKKLKDNNRHKNFKSLAGAGFSPTIPYFFFVKQTFFTSKLYHFFVIALFFHVTKWESLTTKIIRKRRVTKFL